MGTVTPLRPASVSVLASTSLARPIAIQVETRSGVSAAVLTVQEAEAVHATLGQLIERAKGAR